MVILDQKSSQEDIKLTKILIVAMGRIAAVITTMSVINNNEVEGIATQAAEIAVEAGIDMSAKIVIDSKLFIFYCTLVGNWQ